MSYHIAVAGKGGTGKTTITALIIREIVNAGKGPVLAIDADANSNLHEALGIEVEDTLAGVLARINNNLEPLPAGMTKDKYVAYRVYNSLAEGDDVDLLVMGGPEGPGCYCYANNLIRGFVQELSGKYPCLVMDNEAGLEHLSRRTTNNIDVLLVTSDASVRGIRSARRVRELVEGLDLKVKKMFLVVNMADQHALEVLGEEIEGTGLALAGYIPVDQGVREYDLHSRPLYDLPDQSPAVQAVRQIAAVAGIL